MHAPPHSIFVRFLFDFLCPGVADHEHGSRLTSSRVWKQCTGAAQRVAGAERLARQVASKVPFVFDFLRIFRSFIFRQISRTPAPEPSAVAEHFFESIR